eukprot:7309337-Pyramimonas_sp.AAC.1
MRCTDAKSRVHSQIRSHTTVVPQKVVCQLAHDSGAAEGRVPACTLARCDAFTTRIGACTDSHA